jgi:hypothetical protein
MEPVTIGAAAAAVLGMAGEAIVKTAAGEAVKDAYKALKAKIASWAASDVEALEKTPGSAARRNVLAEVVDAQSPEEQVAVQALAQKLTAALKDARPVGLDIGRLDALAVDLGNITVTEGTGARIGHARVLGTFKTGDIKVGDQSAKK